MFLGSYPALSCSLARTEEANPWDSSVPVAFFLAEVLEELQGVGGGGAVRKNVLRGGGDLIGCLHYGLVPRLLLRDHGLPLLQTCGPDDRGSGRASLPTEAGGAVPGGEGLPDCVGVLGAAVAGVLDLGGHGVALPHCLHLAVVHVSGKKRIIVLGLVWVDLDCVNSVAMFYGYFYSNGEKYC